MASPASNRPTLAMNATQWRVLLLIMAFAVLCHFNRVGMSVVGKGRLMEEFHFSEVQVGAIYSSYLVIYMLLMIPGGWLIERIGPRKALGWMGLGSATFVILTGLPAWGALPAAAALPAFMIIRGALGFVTAPMHPGAARAVAIWIPATGQSWGNGMVVGAAVLGASSTYLLLGKLIDAMSWQGVFLMTGLLTLAVTTIWFLYTTDHPAVHTFVSGEDSPDSADAAAAEAMNPPLPRSASLIDIIQLLRDRSLALTTISYVSFGYFQFLFLYWMEYYFDKVLLMSKDDSRLYSTMVSLTMAVGMIVGGFLSDRLESIFGIRWGRATLTIATMLGSAVAAAIGIHLSEPKIVVACFAASMGLLGMCEGTFFTTAVERGGARGALGAAIMNTGGNVGGMLSPYTTPLIARYFDWKAGIELACLFCIMGAILWIWIEPGDRPQPQIKRDDDEPAEEG